MAETPGISKRTLALNMANLKAAHRRPYFGILHFPLGIAKKAEIQFSADWDRSAIYGTIQIFLHKKISDVE